MQVWYALALPYVLHNRESGISALYRVCSNTCETIATIRRGWTSVGINHDTEKVFFTDSRRFCSLSAPGEGGISLPVNVWPSAILATDTPEIWYSVFTTVYRIAHPYTETGAVCEGIYLQVHPISVTRNNYVLCSAVLRNKETIAVIRPGEISWDTDCTVTACNVAASTPQFVRVVNCCGGDSRLVLGEIKSDGKTKGKVCVEGGEIEEKLYASVEGEYAVVTAFLSPDTDASLVYLFRKANGKRGNVVWAGIVPGKAQHVFIDPPFAFVGVSEGITSRDADVHIFSDGNYVQTIRFDRSGQIAFRNLLLDNRAQAIFSNGRWLLPIGRDSGKILQTTDEQTARELLKITRTDLPHTVFFEFAE